MALVLLSLLSAFVSAEPGGNFSEAGAIQRITSTGTSIEAVHDREAGHVTQVTLRHAANNAFVYLRYFTRLQQLNILDSPKLTAVRLNDLRAADLEIIWIRDTPVGDSALAGIGSFKKLRHLGLSNTRITAKGLEAMGMVTTLCSVDLSRNARLQSGDFSPVGKLKQLDTLNVEATGFGDADAEHLSALDKLSTLVLADTKITDSGLRHLESLGEDTLLTIYLNEACVTQQGVDRLETVP